MAQTGLEAALDNVCTRILSLKSTLSSTLEIDAACLVALQRATSDLETIALGPPTAASQTPGSGGASFPVPTPPASQGSLAEGDTASLRPAGVMSREPSESGVGKLVKVPTRRRTGVANAGALSSFQTVSLPATPVQQQARPIDDRKEDIAGLTPMAIEALVFLGRASAGVASNSFRSAAAEAAVDQETRVTTAAVPRFAALEAVAGMAGERGGGVPVRRVAPPSRSRGSSSSSEDAAATGAWPAKFEAGQAFAQATPAPSKNSGAKRCSCKKSQCLKLYCDCFAAGGFCGPDCFCLGCSNSERTTETVMEARAAVLIKDPNAFSNKVLQGEGHRKGCRCKKSKCRKKYCECFNAGVPCNPANCQCDGCENCDPSDRGNGDSPTKDMEPLVISAAPVQLFKSSESLPVFVGRVIDAEPAEQQLQERRNSPFAAGILAAAAAAGAVAELEQVAAPGQHRQVAVPGQHEPGVLVAGRLWSDSSDEAACMDRAWVQEARVPSGASTLTAQRSTLVGVGGGLGSGDIFGGAVETKTSIGSPVARLAGTWPSSGDKSGSAELTCVQVPEATVRPAAAAHFSGAGMDFEDIDTATSPVPFGANRALGVDKSFTRTSGLVGTERSSGAVPFAKRPRRAASLGVAGAVAAVHGHGQAWVEESAAAQPALHVVPPSPLLKRRAGARGSGAGIGQSQPHARIAARVGLLKKDLGLAGDFDAGEAASALFQLAAAAGM